MSIKLWGIDVSKYNAPITWSRVKTAGVKYVIIRVGFASIANRNKLCKDPYFESFYKGAKSVGLPVGVYFYSRCNSENTAKAEAEFIIKNLAGKTFEYPIFLDVEDTEDTLQKVSKQTMTNVVKTCLDTIANAGYYVGIYSRRNILRDYMHDEQLSKYDHWIAQYARACGYAGKKTMWQFGAETNLLKGKRISGIGSDVADQNYCYVDYPSKIKELGLNGFKKIDTVSTKAESTKVEIKVDRHKDITQVDCIKDLQKALNKSYKTNLVIDGKYGIKTKTIIAIHSLKYGNKNDHVKWLQECLNNINNSNLKVDGNFGKLTLNAIEDFQSKNGLKVDGVVGSLTHEKLINKI